MNSMQRYIHTYIHTYIYIYIYIYRRPGLKELLVGENSFSQESYEMNLLIAVRVPR